MSRSVRWGPWILAVACAPGEADDGVIDDSWMLERDCIAAAGLGRPQHISEVVTLINALPMPVTLTCVLEALDRPLTVAAATSPFSAQPTEDVESPRLFVLSGELVMSLVTIGEAAHSLEFGEYVEPGRTLKGEIVFPVETALAQDAPYAGALLGSFTRCGTCHGDERFAGMVGDVPSYTSSALAPEPHRVVPVGFVEQHARDCQDEDDPSERCALLGAVFGHGDVGSGGFRIEDRICVTP